MAATGDKDKIFRYNPGKHKVIFPKHHPYYKRTTRDIWNSIAEFDDTEFQEMTKPIGNKTLALNDISVPDKGTLKEKLNAVEKQIHRGKNEAGIVFLQNGKAKVFIGDEKGIKGMKPSFNGEFENAVITHNHPTDTNLSLNDITLAIEYNLKEIRNVALNKVYSIKRPESG